LPFFIAAPLNSIKIGGSQGYATALPVTAAVKPLLLAKRLAFKIPTALENPKLMGTRNLRTNIQPPVGLPQQLQH